ncbi:MAG: hypothetical protein FVQ83_04570 [Chloroflexi bacterium]|nr:hypothetical protein [Chloroflexota bacterium]
MLHFKSEQKEKLFLILLLLMTACAGTENQQSTAEISTISERTLPATWTLSPSPTSTFTLTPTITATVTSTTAPT